MTSAQQEKKDSSQWHIITMMAYLFKWGFDLCDFSKWFLKLNKEHTPNRLFFFPLLLELQFVGIIDIARSAIAYFCIWLLRLLFAYEKLIEKPWSSTSPKTIQQAA